MATLAKKTIKFKTILRKTVFLKHFNQYFHKNLALNI